MNDSFIGDNSIVSTAQYASPLMQLISRLDIFHGARIRPEQ